MRKVLFILFVLFCACEKDSGDNEIFAGVSGKPPATVITHTHPWSDIILLESDKAYLNKQLYIPVMGRTTAEINATVPADNDFGIAYDKELKVYKAWNGTTWKNIILQ